MQVFELNKNLVDGGIAARGGSMNWWCRLGTIVWTGDRNTDYGQYLIKVCLAS